MAGIALFAPDWQIYNMAEEILKQGTGHVKVLKRIEDGEEAVLEARNAVSEGVSIIIARGQQAEVIRRYTNISVVDIALTAQEVGLLIQKLRKKIGKTRPKIGLVGHAATFWDITHLGELLDVEVSLYPQDGKNDFQQVEQAIADGADGIIGGFNILNYLKNRNVATEYFASTEESVRNAIIQAEAMYRMGEIERTNNIHFTSIMESATNGLLQMDNKGMITVINHAMEQILRRPTSEVAGRPVTEILEGLDENSVQNVLTSPKESYASFLKIRNENLVALMTPVVIAGKVDGAILSCNKVKRPEGYNETKQMQDQYLRGYVARNTFDSLNEIMSGMPDTIEMAKNYALTDSPILIKGHPGDEREELAQAIHNHSLRKSGPYISVNLAGLSDEAQIELLFGKRFLNPETKDKTRGALMAADKGTLVIHALDKMGIRTQYFINSVIQNNNLVYNDLLNVHGVSTRIIGVCTVYLTSLWQQHRFRDDLYYVFHTMMLELPAICERRKDLEQLIDRTVARYIEKYSKFHIFTDGAKQVMMNYNWEGNRIQVERFCERMVLMAGKRTITDKYVTELLEQVYGKKEQETAEAEEVLTEESTIRKALRQNNGNKSRTAKELRISTTTLWRKMKKYHIDEGM